MMELYNDALLRFMSQIRWQGKPVPSVFAGADRAYSAIKDWLEKERGIRISTSAGEASVPYPFMAIWREPFQENAPLVSSGIFRIPSFPNAGYGFAMRSPRPVKARCDVNIYFKDKTQAEFLELQMRSLFINKISYITVDFNDTRWYQPPNDVYSYAKVLGYQDLLIEEDSLTDNSSLEDSGLRQREIRYTLSFNLSGWIPFQPYMVPLANEVIYEVREKTSGELIATTTTNKPD